jgi:hypothetical protein
MEFRWNVRPTRFCFGCRSPRGAQRFFALKTSLYSVTMVNYKPKDYFVSRAEKSERICCFFRSYLILFVPLPFFIKMKRKQWTEGENVVGHGQNDIERH